MDVTCFCPGWRRFASILEMFPFVQICFCKDWIAEDDDVVVILFKVVVCRVCASAQYGAVDDTEFIVHQAATTYPVDAGTVDFSCLVFVQDDNTLLGFVLDGLYHLRVYIKERAVCVVGEKAVELFGAFFWAEAYGDRNGFFRKCQGGKRQ